MLHCYLSDTALLPAGYLLSNAKNTTTYGEFLSKGSGVGQITDRVLSVFNTDSNLSDNIDTSPGLIFDPRVGYDANNKPTNDRIRAGLLFRDSTSLDTNNAISDYRCDGKMCLHYDTTLEKRSSAAAGDKLSTISISKDELTCLFNIIERAIYTHSYSPNKSTTINGTAIEGAWEYTNIDGGLSALEQELINSSYSYISQGGGFGYVPDSLRLSPRNSKDKVAAVKFVSSLNAVTTFNHTASGNILNELKPIYFPSYITFDFVFSGFQAQATGNEVIKTSIMIYLDPESLLTRYDPSTIVKIVLPTSPEAILTDNYGDSAVTAVSAASAYVGNVLTGAVSTDILSNLLTRENYTGATTFSIEHTVGAADDSVGGMSSNTTSVNLTFTCLYKGRAPTVSEMHDAIRTFLQNYATEHGYTVDIDSIFPELSVVASFVIIPFYDMYERIESNGTFTIAKNITSLDKINTRKNCVAGDLLYGAAAAVLNIPSYNFIALVLPKKVSVGENPNGLFDIDAYKHYQAISTTSDYWDSMTDSEKQLNMYLARMVSLELNVDTSDLTAVAVLRDYNQQYTYLQEQITINSRICDCYTFTIVEDGAAVTFSIIKRASAAELFQG